MTTVLSIFVAFTIMFIAGMFVALGETRRKRIINSISNNFNNTVKTIQDEIKGPDLMDNSTRSNGTGRLKPPRERSAVTPNIDTADSIKESLTIMEEKDLIKNFNPKGSKTE